MILAPKDLLEKLEFDKVIDWIERECVGELGKEAVRSIQPVSSFRQIERWLTETAECKLALERNEQLPITVYHDLSEDLKMLEIEDYVLPEESLRRINKTLVVARDLFGFFNKDRQESFPVLYNIIRPVSFDPTLIAAIEKVIDKEGNIRPDASPGLQKIRQQMGFKQKELDKAFRYILNEYRKRGMLADTEETMRNGRRVLCVPAEYKRQIRGIIHDESTTGRTAFIEPEQVIEINNDIFDLEVEERREIYRILKELSAQLRPYAPDIRSYQEVLIVFDVIYAKARFAMRIHGNLPQLHREPRLHLVNGRHPLLYLKNSQIGKRVVPFTLTLQHSNRLLLLSGPNAGGKSITMKSVGLMQLMIQAGMLVPVDPHSEMGIFFEICADIGDQQSIEDDLSTYSSRLNNMRIFLENVGPKSLILIDEFGSGTDPKIGGAIAESILREFNERNVYGVVTTHYSNLKVFAFKNKGIVNGCMLFDKEHLTPTYELKVGRPGSSYAYEIAQKSGLPDNVLDYARHRTGKNEKAIDELLVDLQSDQISLSDQLSSLREKEAKLDRLMKMYDQMHKDFEFRRKRLKLELKEQALQQTARDSKELDKLVREIRETQNIEVARQRAEALKAEQIAIAQEVKVLKTELHNEIVSQSAPEKRKISQGDYVKLITGGATGKVEALKPGKAIVQIGDMRMTIAITDLQPINEPLDVRDTRSIKTDVLEFGAALPRKIDIRGMSLEEGLRIIETYVDQALMSGMQRLEILHGKGTGVLRNAVRTKIREYTHNIQISHPPRELGGDGVTIVEIL